MAFLYISAAVQMLKFTHSVLIFMAVISVMQIQGDSQKE